MRFNPADPRIIATLVAGVVVLLAWVFRPGSDFVGPGQPAPAFAARTLTGTRVTLEEYRGSVVLLNVWATWCPPCREEMPSMERLYRNLNDDGLPFEVVAVSIDRDAGQRDGAGREGGDLHAYVEEMGLTFDVLHDPSAEVQRIFRTRGVPESFLIDRNGVIVEHVPGSADWDTPRYRDMVRQIFDR